PPPAPPLPRRVTAPPPRPAQVSWTITSDPPGAEVVAADGTSLGRTPLLKQREPAAGKVALVLRKAGFKDSKLEVDGARDTSVSVKLVPRRPVVSKDKDKGDHNGVDIL